MNMTYKTDIDKTKFPRYFDVDGIPVKVFEDNGELTGQNHLGFAWPPIKALFDGNEISEDQFYKMKSTLKADVAR